MKLRLPHELVRKLMAALQRAGSREIGGQLFGKQLAVSEFEATELAIQKRPGTIARFAVDLLQATRDAMRFFARTRHSYRQFNYIGEWHSHPSFAVMPSAQDIATMRDLARDPEFKGTFAVLMIVRADGATLNAGAWVFDPQGRESSIDLELADE